MTEDVSAAILLLQRRAERYFQTSSYWTERYDRALDELVRNPFLTGNAPYLARNASANAGKILRRRRELVPVIDRAGRDAAETDRDITSAPDPRTAAGEDVFVRDWLETTLASPDRIIIHMMMDGHSVAEIAAHLGCTPAQARVRMSRARSRARGAWAA